MARKEYGEISFGEWLQDELNEREITQIEVAKRAGVSSNTVNRICRGWNSPSLIVVESVLGALGLRFAIVEDEKVWPGHKTRQK